MGKRVLKPSGNAAFPPGGGTQEEILKLLERKLEADMTFDSGRILGSMCSSPDPFGALVFADQIEKNIGDPGLHPALAELESETIRTIGSLLHNPQAVGAIVSGGTEANLLAMWTAKNRAPREKREVVLPVTAHFSFDKAAGMMDLTLIKVPVDADNRVRIDDFRKAVGPRTMALVGIAGTTGLGAVDPLVQMSEIAEEHDIYLHVDAAFGGFVLPFLDAAGYPHKDTVFDFTLPGVDSITIDPHKMGRSPIPGGCILYRNDEIAGHSATDVTYLAGGQTRQRTILGTRSGASVAAIWSIIQLHGFDGYTAIVRSCMENTLWLKTEMDSLDMVETVIEPVVNVLGIRPRSTSAEILAERLRRRGLALSLFPGFLRITLMPHLTRLHLSRFLEILQEEADK